MSETFFPFSGPCCPDFSCPSCSLLQRDVSVERALSSVSRYESNFSPFHLSFLSFLSSSLRRRDVTDSEKEFCRKMILASSLSGGRIQPDD